MRINYPQREFVCSVLLLSVVAVVQIANFPSQSFIFFYGKDIVLEFILGMALAVWYRNRFRFREKVDHWVYFIFAGALLVLLKEPGEIVDLRFFYWGLPAAVVVFCFLHFEAAFRKAPQGLKKGFLLGGELSYPLYLIHPYFIVFFSRVLNAKEFGAFFLFSISLLGASVASYMVLVFYDKPLRARLSGLCLGDSGRH